MRIYRLTSAMLLAALLAGCAWIGSNTRPAYDVKVVYRQNRPLEFPDFTLTFLGQRHVDDPVFKPGFTYYDFKLQGAGQEQVVSWSSGTGDIGPALFEFAGRGYRLELAYSDKLGRLADNELVIGPQP